jgi:4a-hydroxytetrahydrobiopterin dehydratase
MAEPELLTDDQIQGALKEIGGWELRDGRIRKQFTFRTFLRAIAFVNSVAYLAEGQGHHPDMTINYNKVTLRIVTHSAGGLTDRDFALARAIDERLTSKLIIDPDEKPPDKKNA